jgi:predicted signal transduction protein with EAL and GGDEF domain
MYDRMRGLCAPFLLAAIVLFYTGTAAIADDNNNDDVWHVSNAFGNVWLTVGGVQPISLAHARTLKPGDLSKLRVNSDDMAIVGAAISLGKLLGLSVIAEGIEDRDTADLLRSRGCDEGQGYYFGRPMPASEFEQRFLSKEVILTPSIAVQGVTAA